MISVIRIEHPSDGKGLWNSDEGMTPRIKKHSMYKNISNRHSSLKYPTYEEDNELNKQLSYEELENYHFAFLNLEQFREALTNEEIKECINNLGFQVLMLDVTDYYTSSYQAVFNKESIVSSKDISFMFI